MTLTEIVAYIGAAAWLPQIATWIYRSVIQPIVTIVPDKYADVGFTSYGPIFNMRMAFSVENKDLIVDGFELLFRHSDGDTHTLRWAGLKETFSEITDESGNRQVISRDQTPIALKIGTESLIEKFVRFQEPRYHETDRPVILNLIAHFNFLKRSKPEEYVSQTLSSKEFFSVLETREKAFWWKPGHYQIAFRLSSPKKFTLTHSQLNFELTSVDIDRLKENVTTLEIELKDVISSNLPDFKREVIDWNWANVNVHISDKA
jgi:hypothetical protein